MRNYKLLKAVVVGLLFLPVLSHIAFSQEKLRGVREMPQSNPPIAVVGRQIADKQFERGVQVMAGNDWLNQLTFEVKNVSEKNIVFFEIYLRIPPAGKIDAGKIVGVSFGDRLAPLAASRRILTEIIRPGNTTTVKISEADRTQVEKFLRSYDVVDVELVEMTIREVHFDDGSGWAVGAELRQDPSKPKRWIPVTQSNGEVKLKQSSLWIVALTR